MGFSRFHSREEEKKSGRANENAGGFTDDNVRLLGQHQRLGHHIDSSNDDGWGTEKEKTFENDDECQTPNHRGPSRDTYRT